MLLDELRQLGLDENTLVLFTSDNGSRNRDEGGSNAPLRGTKGTTWEGGMRLPCIVRWPGQVPAGTTCSEVVASMDLLPTFARLAGTREPDDRVIDGHDISRADARRGRRPLAVGGVLLLRRRPAGGRAARTGGSCGSPSTRTASPSRAGSSSTTWRRTSARAADVAGEHPDVVAELRAAIERGREELGDEATGAEGRNIRPIGRVEDPKPLTEYDPDHPYIIAIYDLEDAG